jgi:1,5-anhydro-D-fructose reductase (1,5-anhydro-D-mannitol-forming)
MSSNTGFKSPIRWGIIGCGDVTEVKSGPAYKLAEGFELKAVMRRNEEKLRDYASRHQIEKCYTNADDLINDNEIDAVYIATPPDSHREYAIKVATAGKPCCIEKPLAPTYADSKAIVEAFEKRGVPLFTAYYRRSLPRFVQVETWLKNGEIGAIRHINWQLMKPPSEVDLAKKENWRTEAHVAPGGYFDDLASHGLDLFTFLLGDIKEVAGFSLNQQNLYSAKDAVSATWLHENGATGTGSWNFGCDHHLDRVEIFGSSGKIEFSVFEENPIRILKEGKAVELTIEHPKNVQLHHVQNMSKQLFDSSYTHPSTGITAAHTSWVMDKILGQL